MAKAEKPKGPRLIEGKFARVWGRATGRFERHQELIPGTGEGEARTPNRVRITDLQTGINTDVGFSGGKGIGGFEGASSLVSTFSGGGAEGGLDFDISNLRATFRGTVSQVQTAEGKTLVESHLTADITESIMAATGVSGMGQVRFSPAPGVSITVVSGREISETEE